MLQHFSSLVDLVYHPSNPRLADKWERPALVSSPGHDLWCEVTWSHMILTLQEWSYHLQGLKVRSMMQVYIIYMYTLLKHDIKYTYVAWSF